MIEFKHINHKEQITNFINSCSDELQTFRYFKSRPHDIFENHIYSYMIYHDNIPIAYYHVEKENEFNWFGICILKQYQKNGLGSLIMNHMLYCAKFFNLKSINLTVDLDNYKAINLYNKFGFKIQEVNGKYLKMINIIKH